MNILKTQKFKATTWLDETKTVEGSLHLLDLKTLKSADPQVNRNGYLMTIKNSQGIDYVIAPDTLEVVQEEKSLFDQITQWQKETFGNSTSLSKVAHLKKEIKELKKDLETRNPDRRLEFADCFFLLYGAAAADGMTYDDICCAILEKLTINKARKWGEPDKDGVVSHIKN